MNNEKISKRQNEELMLRFQFAARKCYNTAENLDIGIWVVCFIAWLTILLPSGGAWDTVALCISTVMDIAAFILFWQLSENIKRASSLRAYFDAYVLNIALDRYSQTELRQLEEWALDAEEKSPSEYSVQVAHTGHDTPPGVRDWYEFSLPCSGLSAIFVCQKQNCWWTNKVAHSGQIIATIISICALGLFILVAYAAWPEKSIWQIALSAVGIILKVVERISSKFKYRHMSDQLTGASKALESNLTEAGILNFQKLIDERRAIPVVESNLVHRLRARVLSERYLKLTQ